MTNLLLAVIYLAFVSLGLPDSLLGSAWPAIYPELGLPISAQGAISMIIALGTIISSLMSDRLTHRLGTGKVTALSVVTTAVALFGFSTSHSLMALCLWAIPYGLGAGCVDAALNNYVVLHYESRHTSWLHCMWGIGAAIGPVIMGYALGGSGSWTDGYLAVAIIQIVLSIFIFASLPLWKSNGAAADDEEADEPLTLRETLAIPGVKEMMVSFCCYEAVEQTTILWGSSYLTEHVGISVATAASCGGLFLAGITVGRAISGVMTMRYEDDRIVRIGLVTITAGIVTMALPLGTTASLVGLVLLGLGCAPVYPCLIHSIPQHFGAKRSHAVIGVSMAAAYTGTCLLPPLFGLIAQALGVGLLPGYLACALATLAIAHTKMVDATKATRPAKVPVKDAEGLQDTLDGLGLPRETAGSVTGAQLSILMDSKAVNVDGIFCDVAQSVADMSGATAETIYDALTEREEISTTAFKDGIAIPHASVKGIDKGYIVVVKTQTGITWDSLDNKPVTCAIAVIEPNSRKKNEPSLVSKAAFILTIDELRERMVLTQSEGEVESIVTDILDQLNTPVELAA